MLTNSGGPGGGPAAWIVRDAAEKYVADQ